MDKMVQVKDFHDFKCSGRTQYMTDWKRKEEKKKKKKKKEKKKR